MDALHGTGLQELVWSPGPGMPHRDEIMSFTARNIHIVRSGRSPPDRSSRGRVRTYSVEGFTLVHAASSGKDLQRRLEVRDVHAIAEDRVDRFAMVVYLSGRRRILQRGKTQYCRPGEPALYCTSEPYLAESDPGGGKIEMIGLFAPRRYVEERGGSTDSASSAVASKGAADLGTGVLTLLAAHAWNLNRAEFHRSARAAADMFLLGFHGGSKPAAEPRTTRALNLARVKRALHQNLSNPELKLADVAQISGLSLNYIHKLFRDDGVTLWAYLKAERLKQARHLLMASTAREVSITEIALACGFADSSYFSRAFRQAFGITPSEACRL